MLSHQKLKTHKFFSYSLKQNQLLIGANLPAVGLYAMLTSSMPVIIAIAVYSISDC